MPARARTPYWNGERIVTSEEIDAMFEDPQKLQCPKCEHVASIDYFDCAGMDLEFPELGIGPEGNDVWCPACGEEIPAVFVEGEGEAAKQATLF